MEGGMDRSVVFVVEEEEEENEPTPPSPPPYLFRRGRRSVSVDGRCGRRWLRRRRAAKGYSFTGSASTASVGRSGAGRSRS